MYDVFWKAADEYTNTALHESIAIEEESAAIADQIESVHESIAIKEESAAIADQVESEKLLLERG